MLISCFQRLAKLGWVLVLLGVFFTANFALAQRAAGPQLLPKETMAFVRIANVPEFANRFRDTGMGKMLVDPQLKPLLDHLYGKASEAVDEVKDKTGISLDEMLQIPKGEITFGVVPRKEKPPALVLVIDTGESVENARKLLKKIEEQTVEIRRREEQIEGQTVTVFNSPRSEEMIMFEREGTFVFTSALEIVPDLIKQWSGRDGASLNDNPKYGTIMRACRAKDEDPQLTWFVDPIKLVSEIFKGNFSVQAGLAFLPALGLDGLRGVGGSMAFSVGEFDSLAHFHLLLDHPRAGVIDALQLTEGDMKPQSWVPDDVAGYMTIYWDAQATYRAIEKLIDSFQGEGRTAEELKRNFSDEIGIDVVSEILPLIKGRVTYLSRIPKRNQGLAAQANAEGNRVAAGLPFGRGADQLLAIELTDTAKAQKLLERVLEKRADAFEKKSWSGQYYYAVKMPEPPVTPDGDPLPLPEPCFAIGRGCLLIADHHPLLQSALSTLEANDTLAEALDYKLMAGKLLRETNGGKVGMLSFQRPEESLKYFWDMAVEEQTRKRLARAAENNRFFQTLDGALTEHPLPPFSAVEKYFAPSGGILTNEDTGFHFQSFTLRRKLD